MEVKNRTRITAAKMRLMRQTAKYVLVDHKRKEETLRETKTKPELYKISKYKSNWMQRVKRIQSETLQTTNKLQSTGTKERRTILEETSSRRLRPERIGSDLTS
jgi:hypothetical protein